MSFLLRIDNLTVIYKQGVQQVAALKNVSFTIEPGEIICILGSNGAGKTTLLKCISQLVAPSDGSITWAPVLPKKGNALHIRLGVLLEGSRAFYWNLTGRENARYFAALKGLSLSAETELHLDDLFTLLNLDSVKNRIASTYSTGMKKRLSLLISLLGNPSLLLLDEPTQGLDNASLKELEVYLQRIAATGTAVLCASHDLAFTFNVATRLWCLESGQLQTWDWKMASTHYNQVVFLLAGENLPASLLQGNTLLTALPGGRVRLAGCMEDQGLYQLLWQLIVEHQVRVLQIYSSTN